MGLLDILEAAVLGCVVLLLIRPSPPAEEPVGSGAARTGGIIHIRAHRGFWEKAGGTVKTSSPTSHRLRPMRAQQLLFRDQRPDSVPGHGRLVQELLTALLVETGWVQLSRLGLRLQRLRRLEDGQRRG